MRELSSSDVGFTSIKMLGLNPAEFELTSIETIACALRRAAGFLCPTTARTLILSVTEPVRGLVDHSDNYKEIVVEVLEALVAHGDLLELNSSDQDEDSGHGALLYAAPPSFIRRQSGALILLGITPDHISPLPNELQRHIIYKNHIRILDLDNGQDVGDQLAELSFIELPMRIWSKVPQKESASQHISKLNNILDRAPPCGEVLGLVLLDSSKPVLFYPGRWVNPTTQTGRYVGRRVQAYGADLWCHVEMSEGRPIKVIDFPLRDDVYRGCDIAWQLQAAIDRESGRPQSLRVGQRADNSYQIDLFSPVPSWARRRWAVTGEEIQASNCLLSYIFSKAEIDEELRFVQEYLWYEVTT